MSNNFVYSTGVRQTTCQAATRTSNLPYIRLHTSYHWHDLRRKIDKKLGEEEQKEYYNARQNPIRDVHKDTQTVATSRADKNKRRKLSGTRNRRAIIPEY